MGTRDQHLEAAALNERMSREMTQDHEVWTPTLIFYTCVQLSSAAFAAIGERHQSHADREAVLAARWPAANAPYHKLKQLSCEWRYNAERPSSRDIERARRWGRDLATAIDEDWPS